MQNAGPETARKDSLVDQIWRRLRRRSAATAERAARRIADGETPFAPLPIVHGLERLSALCGKPAGRSHLTAGLPVHDGDLDPRFAAFAMARVGLDARWQTISLATVATHDLPALVPLYDGGVILLLCVQARSGTATIVDASGEHDVAIADLHDSMRGEMLVCGHLDPENGLDEEAERSLLQRNPRLWLVGTFLSEKKRLWQLLLAALFLNLCALAIPLYMRAIYDRVVPNLAIESLWALSVGMVLVLVFEYFFRSIRGAFVDAVALKVGQVVQHRAMHAILHARMANGGKSAGAFMVGLRDTEQLAALAPLALVTFLVDIPCFFGFLALIVMLGGTAVAGPLIGGAGLVIVGLIANYALKLASNRTSKLMQARNNLVVEVADGWSTIKANQAEGLFLRQWDIVADHIGVGTKGVRHWNEILGGMSALLVQAVTVLVVVIGVFQIKDGIMTTGALVAVTMLTGRAMVPVSSAVGMVGKLYQALAQFQGLAQILATPPERALSDPSIRPHRVRGDIRLQALSHRFEGASEDSLTDIGFKVSPGEKIALIGKSGSGKSTLLQLIGGLIEPMSGGLTVDGHAIGQYAPSFLRQHIVYGAQDAALFDRSIWENILLGMPEPDDRIVEQAVRASALDNFVSRTVEGYGRKIGPRGQRLSGGQRQCLLLARALVRNPSVLLLDEPTAAMDIACETMVINGLREATADKTVIVATHRMALLELVDRVIWLEDGKVKADKPRDEIVGLMRSGPGAATAQAA
ncbi:ATP-binding cassette domain-containing protein [Allosphingosinicella deserti]|uniref:ATP-binding cassette domain-containing protein n=1 Tax=Allosphingosinicella deserti TaxID=2116704 RepID=UPI001304AC21|nr:ATP-binding cassette domain-containing protein [Sphingomonas deserti]